MTLLFFFLIAIFVATLTDRKKWALILLAVLSLHLVLSGGGVFTSWALRDLQRFPRAQPEWAAKNAIVILGFGTVKWDSPDPVTSASFAYARLFEGLRLYRSCAAARRECKVLVTGGDPLRNGEAEAVVMARELAGAGLPKEDILIEDQSSSTFANARNSAPLLQGFDRLYLVTSGLHMRRAQIYFDHFVKGMIPAPADRLEAWLTVIPISPNLIYFDFAMHEYLGILRYEIYNLMGWNPPRIGAG